MSTRNSQSPSFFSRQGFQPINNNNMSQYEADIPLTTVRTTTSTGARKPTFDTTSIMSANTLQDEKKGGHFGRKVGAGRRKKTVTRTNTEGEEVAVTAMGRLYNKVVNFSVITRYMVYVIPVATLIAAPIVAYAILNPDAVIGGVRVYLFFTWIEVIWLSVWVSKLLAKMVPPVFMALCGVVSSGTKKYALILQNVEIPLSLVGWAVASLVSFTFLTSGTLNGQQDHWVTVMKQVLAPTFIASLIYLGEKLCIQLVSVNYHRRSFDSKIQESKHTIYLLGLLYEASRSLFPMYCPEFIDEDYAIADGIEALLAASNLIPHESTHGSGSATPNPVRFLGNIGRIGGKVTSVFGNIAHEITGKQVFNPTSAHSVVIEALEKVRSSEALGKRLWMSFVVEGKEALYADDLEEVLGPGRKDEAEEIFAALDGDGNGDITLDEMVMKVVEIGRERKSIAASMHDVAQAIDVLDQVLIVVIFVIIVFIFVAFQDTNFVTTLATAGTTLLSLSFVFAATTQEFLGSCIFLFVKHPYDVGDRVDIVGSEKEFLVVEQIALLYTVFKRIDNMKMVQVPNIILNNLWIENITRSKAMKEQLDMYISFDTTLEDIDLLRSEMQKFVLHAENARDFQPDILLEAVGIGNMDKLQLKIEIRHKSNWHNETVRAARRSKFMCALVLALRKVPIYAPGGGGEPLGGANNPGYSVPVTDDWAVSARAKAADTKEGKRLVPSASAAKGSAPTEEKAAEALNARDPTADAVYSADYRDDVGDSTGMESQANRNSLVKRASTSGRRKPGETLPPVQTGTGLGVTITEPSPRFNSFDEEQRVGMSGVTNPYQDYTTYTTAAGPGPSINTAGMTQIPLGSHPSQQQPQHPSLPGNLSNQGSGPR